MSSLTPLTETDIVSATFDDFRNYAAARIQAAFRGRIHRKAYLGKRRAVLIIQTAWRIYAKRETAALKIQSAWECFKNRRIFKYYKDLLKFKSEGDPKLLLKCINPREASLLDSALGVYLRFRLGGESFPPMIYYKLFTHRPITDVCSFCPRNYCEEPYTGPTNGIVLDDLTPSKAADFIDEYPEEWYQRCENNNWRPVAERVLAGEVPADKPPARNRRFFCHIPVVRRHQALRAKIQKRQKWMKLFMEGREKEASLADEDTEDEDDLVDWCNGLNFDSYLREWACMGCSATSDDATHVPNSVVPEEIPSPDFNFQDLCAAVDAQLPPFIGGIV